MSKVKHHPNIFFNDGFHIPLSSKEQWFYKIMLLKCFLGLKNHVRMPFDTFNKILRCPLCTNPNFGSIPLKSSYGTPKCFLWIPINGKINLTYFSRKLPRGIWRTPGILPVTEIVNHMFTFFAFSQYNLPFFTPSYLLFCQRYSSEIYRQIMILVL